MSEEPDPPEPGDVFGAYDDGFVPTPIERLNAALEGRYEVTGELGEGGMAIVYRARDLKHDRDVAIKVLRREWTDTIVRTRFEAEIRTVAGLHHPNLMPLFDSGEADGSLYFVMALVDGRTLQDRIDEAGPLPVEEAVELTRQIADGLQYAHEARIVHRDVKPGNVMLHHGKPLLVDFGVAIGVGTGARPRLTQTGLAVGTVSHMSPEQARADRNVGPKSDQFALATVLFEMLTGQLPYGDDQEALARISASAPVSARAIRPEIPAHVDHALQRAHEPEQRNRFGSCAEFAAALVDPSFRHPGALGPAAGSDAGGRADRALADQTPADQTPADQKPGEDAPADDTPTGERSADETPGDTSGAGSPITAERLDAALEGRYEIIGRVGEGGMAIVYRARDLKHGREVAIKVFKPELAAQIGAERFQAEIRTTAGLQHPNLLPLFDSGEADGSLFYVMPYVEGIDLQKHLAREKQLPTDEAVRIVSEIAEGLDAAHRAGVVHRDIKPANILLRDGRPILMDFGIAIATGATRSVRLTETGLSLGTPFYMSPEQASGDRNVGPASDTYSLAAVLYELLAGRPPSQAPTAQAVLGKIVSSQVVPIRTERPAIPVNVDHAIQRALEKLPADRFPTTGEFARALQDPEYRYAGARPAEGDDPGHPAPAPVEAGAVTRAPGTRAAGMPALPVLALAAVTLVLASVLGWSLSRPPAASAPETVHFTLLPTGEDVDFVGTAYPGISADGRLVAFPARIGDTTRIQIRDLSGFGGRWVPGTEDGFSPFFSPDGRWLGFFTVNEIRKVPIEGGQPTTIATVPFLMDASAVWLPSDTIVFNHSSYTGLEAVHADGGGTWPVTFPDTLAGEQRHAVPRALPDGRILFQIRGVERIREHWMDGHSGGIVSLADGEVVRLEEPGSPWAYLPGDRLLVWNSGAFRVYPFDLGGSRSTGPATPVRTDLRGNDSCDYLRVSNSGTAVCTDVSAVTARTLAWADREGEPTPLRLGPGEYRWPRVSPDGTAIAAFATNGLVTVDTRTNAVTPIAPAPSGGPAWTPDSREVVFWTQDLTGVTHLRVRDRAAAGPARVLTDDPVRSDWSTAVSPDGSTVLFYDSSDLWTVPLGGGDPTRLLETPGAWERDGAWAPDGSAIAYSSNELGRWEVFVVPTSGTGSRTRVSVSGGRSPEWSADGSELFFVEGSRMMVVDVERTPALRFGTPRELFRGGFWIDPSGDPFYDVAPDGRFLIIEGDDVVQIRVVTGLTGAIGDPGPQRTAAGGRP